MLYPAKDSSQPIHKLTGVVCPINFVNQGQGLKSLDIEKKRVHSNLFPQAERLENENMKKELEDEAIRRITTT